MARFNVQLRAVMEVFRETSHGFPTTMRCIIMPIDCPIYVPTLPMETEPTHWIIVVA